MVKAVQNCVFHFAFQKTPGDSIPRRSLDAIFLQETSMLCSRSHAHLVHDYCFSLVGNGNKPNETQVELVFLQPCIHPQSDREVMSDLLLDDGESTKLRV